MGESELRFVGTGIRSTAHIPDEDGCKADAVIISAPDIRDVTKEVVIRCDSCPLRSNFRIEGESDLANRIQAIEAAQEVIKGNCGEWKDLLAQGKVAGKMPHSFIPLFKYAYRLLRNRPQLPPLH